MPDRDTASEIPSRGDIPSHVVDGLPMPVVVTRLSDDTVVRVNPEYEHAYGFSGPELAGQDFRRMHFVPEDRDAALAAFAGGRLESVEVRIRDRDGECCWAQADISRFDLEGKPVLLTTLYDIGGRKRAEQQAAESSAAIAELARFPDMDPGPVLRLDRSGQVVLANPAAKEVFGNQDLAGRSWFDLCPGVDEQFWSRVWSEEHAVALEETIEGRRYLLTHARGPKEIFVYGSDVTDQKNAEIALRQTEKLATLGTFAAGLAHELNNPATAAQRGAEQLEETFIGLQRSQARLRALDLSEEAAAILRELDAQAREVASSLGDLNPLDRSDREDEVERWLDESGAEDPWELATGLVDLGYGPEALDAFANRVGADAALVLLAWQTRVHEVYQLLGEIRHGSARLVEIVGAMKAYAYLGDAPLQDVDVNEGLRNTLVILRNKLKVGISVRRELDESLPRIQAYGSDLNQVWTNLLDNAVDALEGRGAIVVRSALRDGRVVVEVEDDGPGIPPEVQSRIFDAFFTTKPPGRGTGLGLNTSYKIVVQKHGGAIRVESHPGSTRFVVELPMTPPKSAQGGDTPFTSDQEE